MLRESFADVSEVEFAGGSARTWQGPLGADECAVISLICYRRQTELINGNYWFAQWYILTTHFADPVRNVKRQRGSDKSACARSQERIDGAAEWPTANEIRLTAKPR